MHVISYMDLPNVNQPQENAREVVLAVFGAAQSKIQATVWGEMRRDDF